MKLHPEELHILGLSAPTLLRMLKAREDRVLSKIYGEFKNGKADHTMALAEFACIRDQINEITNALASHEKLEEKKHATTNGRTTDT